MRLFLPTIKPAWGPPSNLSPLKVTTSAPSLASETVGSFEDRILRDRLMFRSQDQRQMKVIFSCQATELRFCDRACKPFIS